MALTRKKDEAPEMDAWLSALAAAAMLGKSKLWLYERALAGEVRHAKVANRRVFAREDVERMAGEPAAVAA